MRNEAEVRRYSSTRAARSNTGSGDGRTEDTSARAPGGAAERGAPARAARGRTGPGRRSRDRAVSGTVSASTVPADTVPALGPVAPAPDHDDRGGRVDPAAADRDGGIPARADDLRLVPVHARGRQPSPRRDPA